MADPRNKPIQRLITPAAPVVATGFALTPDGGGGWLVRSLRFQLVTDANAANRAVMLAISDSSTEYLRLSASAVQAASLTRVYSGSNGAQADAAIGTHIPLRFPPEGFWLPQGHSLTVSVENIQATDQISVIGGSVFEFPTGPKEFLWPFVVTFLEESS